MATNTNNNWYGTYITDPNDPYAINSFADVLFNKQAKQQRYSYLDNSLAQTVAAGVELLYNSAVKPFVGNAVRAYQTGGIQSVPSAVIKAVPEVGINALVNLGETADILANPVKATLIEGAYNLGLGDYGSKYQGDVLQGIKSTFGLNNDGRQSYEWNTGNFITDVILETVSDPLNLISFGTSTAAKETLQPAIKRVAVDSLNIADDAADVLARRMSSDIGKLYLNSKTADDALNAVDTYLKNFSNNKNIANKIILDVGLDTNTAKALTNNIYQSIKDNTLDGVGKLTRLYNTNNFVDTVNNALLKSSLYTSGVGEAIDFNKFVINKAKQIIKPVTDKLDAMPGQVLYNARKQIFDSVSDESGNVLPQFEYLKHLDNITDTSMVPFLQNAKDVTDSAMYANQLYELMLQGYDLDTAERIAKDLLNRGALSTTISSVADNALKNYNYPIGGPLRFVAEEVNPLYKTGMLSFGVGLPLRNTADIILKNTLQRGSVTELPNVIASFYDADKVYRDFNKLYGELVDFVNSKTYSLAVDIPDDIGSLRNNLDKIRLIQTLDSPKSIDDTAIKRFFKEYQDRYGSKPVLTYSQFTELKRLFEHPSKPIEGLTREIKEKVADTGAKIRLSQLIDNLIAVDNAAPTTIEQLIDVSSEFFATTYAKEMRDTMDKHYRLLYKLKDKLFKDIPELAQADNNWFIKFLNDVYVYDKLPIDKNSLTFTAYFKNLYAYDDSESLLSRVINSSPIVKFNDWAETRGRLAHYLESRSKGLSQSEAIEQIAKDHYLYNNKPYSIKVLETFFPFMSFAINNTRHWNRVLNGSADTKRNTTFIKNMINLWLTSAQLNNLTDPTLYDYENMERTEPFSIYPDYPYLYIHPSQQYHLLAGNIPYGDAIQSVNDPAITMQRIIKPSYSFIDALNMSVNPVDQVIGRRYPWLSVPTELFTDYKNNQLQNISSYLIDATPILSTLVQRYSNTPTYLEEFQSPELAIASLFGVSRSNTPFKIDGSVTTATDQMLRRWYAQLKASGSKYNPYDYFKPTGDTKTMLQDKYYNDLKTIYEYKEPTTSIGQYYTQQTKLSKYSRYRNVYKDLYTKKGKARIQIRLGTGTLNMMLTKDLKGAIKHYYYYLI